MSVIISITRNYGSHATITIPPHDKPVEISIPEACLGKVTIVEGRVLKKVKGGK